MTLIRHGKFKVDVAYPTCGPGVPCYHLGFDQGSYTPGRGYTRYHDNLKPVCMTRHLHGCPATHICPSCRTLVSEAGFLATKGRCEWCGDALVKYREASR